MIFSDRDDTVVFVQERKPPVKLGAKYLAESHPQAIDKLRRGAALEAANLSKYKIEFDRLNSLSFEEGEELF